MSGAPAPIYDLLEERRRRRGQQPEQRIDTPIVTTTSPATIMHAETIEDYDDDARMLEGGTSNTIDEGQMAQRPSSELPEWHREMRRTEDRLERRAAEDRGAMRAEVHAIRSEIVTGFAEIRSAIQVAEGKLSSEISALRQKTEDNDRQIIKMQTVAVTLIGILTLATPFLIYFLGNR